MTTSKVIYGHITVKTTSVNGTAKTVNVVNPVDGNSFVTVGYDVNEGGDKLAKLTVFKKDSIRDYHCASVANVDFSDPQSSSKVYMDNEEFAVRCYNGDLFEIHQSYMKRECFKYDIIAPAGYVFANAERIDGEMQLKYKRDVNVSESKGEYVMNQLYIPIHSNNIEFLSAECKDDRQLMLFISDAYRIVKADSKELLPVDLKTMNDRIKSNIK